jgi:hypothetical protein
MEWRARIRFPEVQGFSVLHSVQTDPGAHPAPYPVGIGGSFHGGDRPGREADHSPATSAEVRNGGPICPNGLVPNSLSRGTTAWK